MDTKIAIFRGKNIRKTLYQNEWWFSVVDVCEVLTESMDAGAYWRKLKQRLIAEESQVVTFCHGLKLEAADGKSYETDCANTKGMFRIVQSIPSPKAEPLKRWLAKASTTEIARTKDAQGFMQNKQAAHEGGNVAGIARHELEKKSGKKISTRENYLLPPQPTKHLQKK